MVQHRNRALPRSLANFAGSLYADRAQMEADGELSKWLCSLPEEDHLSFLYYLEQAYKSMFLFVWEPEKLVEQGRVSIKAFLLLSGVIRQSMELGICRQLTPEQLAQVADYWAKVDAGEDPDEPEEQQPFGSGQG